MPHPTEDDVVTVTLNDCCRRTGLSRSTLYRLDKAGSITMLKVGRATLVVWRSVLDYIGGLAPA